MKRKGQGRRGGRSDPVSNRKGKRRSVGGKKWGEGNVSEEHEGREAPFKTTRERKEG